jgi:hypothetical protein
MKIYLKIYRIYINVIIIEVNIFLTNMRKFKNYLIILRSQSLKKFINYKILFLILY